MLTVFSSPEGMAFWVFHAGSDRRTLGPFVYYNQYAAFIEAVRGLLEERGEPFELHQEYARAGDCDVPLLPLAKLPRDGCWRFT